MEKIGLGVIGCGDIAFRSYFGAIRDLADRVELAATCDTDLSRAERAAQEYGAQRAYAHSDDLLADPSVDGVLVLTSMVPHGALCLAALQADKHVYVEKVMAVEMAEADQMVELAERKGLTLSCAPSTILLSAFQDIKKRIDAQEIGHISLIHALGAHLGPARWVDYTSDPTWFYQAGAGPLFDLAVYPVQILTHCFGPVKRLTAFSGLALPEITMQAHTVAGKVCHVGTPDTIPMVLDFGDATFASVDVSYNMLASRLPAMQFFGTGGSLTAPQFLADEVGVWHPGDKEWTINHLPATLYDRLGVAAGLPHWIACIESGTQPVNHARHARHVLDVLLSAQASARSGQAVTLTTTF
jgi:predicted dehydrogenase